MTVALPDHLVVDRADAVEHALQVDVDGAVPGFGRGGVVAEERQRHHPGVVHQHVDAGPPVDRGAHDVVEVGAARDIGSHPDRLATRTDDRVGGGRGRVAVDVAGEDPAPIAAVISARDRPNPPPAPVMTITLPVDVVRP